jgi:hypothetical protein
MPRFFFHLAGGRLVEDSEGEELPTVDDAKIHARNVARELAKHARAGLTARGFIIVMDDRGHELSRIPISEPA